MSQSNTRSLTCAICGKDFIKVYDSIYHIKFARKVCHFCSYTCYRIGMKTKEDTNETIYKKFSDERKRS